jgi:hypothetical protein
MHGAYPGLELGADIVFSNPLALGLLDYAAGSRASEDSNSGLALRREQRITPGKGSCSEINDTIAARMLRGSVEIAREWQHFQEPGLSATYPHETRLCTT